LIPAFSLPTLRRPAPAGLLLLLLLLSFPDLSRAQVNTEKLRSLQEEGFSLTFGGDFSLRSGNSDLFEIGIDSRAEYRSKRHYTFLVGNVRYGERENQAFKNRSFAHLRYNYSIHPRIVGEVFGQVENDEFTRLQLRSLAGAGLRFRYVETEVVLLLQGSSLMFEHERLDPDKVKIHPDQVTAARWSNYVNLRLNLSENLALINTVYVQPRLDAFGDVRILDEAALAIDVSKHLTFKTTFNLFYDSRPPDEVVSTDLSLRNGLVLSL